MDFHLLPFASLRGEYNVGSTLRDCGSASQLAAGSIRPLEASEGHGRDEDCSPPPVQIPACATNPGSSLGFWRRSGEEAAGAAP